jgi:hypothetical protein
MALTPFRWAQALAVGVGLIAVWLLPPSPEPGTFARLIGLNAWTNYEPAVGDAESREEARIQRRLTRVAAEWIIGAARDTAVRQARRMGPGSPATVLVSRDFGSAEGGNLRRVVAAGMGRAVPPPLVPVVPVVMVGGRGPVIDGARDLKSYTAYQLPDSAGRPCVTITFQTNWDLPRRVAPCLYAAAFGAPGRHIVQWLASTGWSTAAAVDWDSPLPAPFTGPQVTDAEYQSLVQALFGFAPLAGTPDEMACRSGDRRACLRVITLPAARFRSAVPPEVPGMTLIHLFGGRPPFGASGAGLLGDLVRTFGRERFQRFWASPLRVEEAFRMAFDTDLADWVHDWAVGRLGPVALGPSLTWHGSLIGLVLVGLAVGVTIFGVSRRQAG